MQGLKRLRLRLEWAAAHLEKVRVAVREFQDLKPYGYAIEDSPEGERTTYTVRLLVHHKPPMALGLAAGDCIHHLRSLLDNLAWEVAPGDRRDIQFPIFLKKEGFDGKRGQSLMSKFPPETHADFEALQPYHTRHNPRSSSLWMLDELWNMDKHRLILPVGLGLYKASRFQVNPPESLLSVDMSTGASEHGAVIARYVLHTPPGHPEPNHQGEIEIHIVFESPKSVKRKDILATLTDLHGCVRDEVLPRFQRFLLH